MRWQHELQGPKLFMRDSNGFLNVSGIYGQRYSNGEEPTVVLYSCYINHHTAGTAYTKTESKHTINLVLIHEILGSGSGSGVQVFRIGCY